MTNVPPSFVVRIWLKFPFPLSANNIPTDPSQFRDILECMSSWSNFWVSHRANNNPKDKKEEIPSSPRK